MGPEGFGDARTVAFRLDQHIAQAAYFLKAIAVIQTAKGFQTVHPCRDLVVHELQLTRQLGSSRTHLAGDPLQSGVQAQPGLDRADQEVVGYPISLQLQKEWAGRLAGSSIDVYIAKKRGKLPAKNFIAKGTREFADYSARRTDPVAIWRHTPEVPLLKRMEMRDVVFAIPKEPLRPKTTYQVEIMLHLQKEFYFVWEFTTGSQMEGLKF